MKPKCTVFFFIYLLFTHLSHCLYNRVHAIVSPGISKCLILHKRKEDLPYIIGIPQDHVNECCETDSDNSDELLYVANIGIAIVCIT